MSKIELSALPSGFATTPALNARLDQIESEFNDKVLYRDNPDGEPNAMNNILDMADHHIVNLPDGVEDHHAVNLGQIEDIVEQEVYEQLTEQMLTVGTGNVIGPLSSVDDQVALYSGITGKLIKAGQTIAQYLSAFLVTLYNIFPRTVAQAADFITTSAEVGQIVYLKEYYAGTGEAGGEFIVKSGVITPNNGTTFASAIAGRYFERINFYTITPEMFGFSGSNLVNDTAALKNALEFPDKPCVLKDGKTYVTKAMVVNNISSKVVYASTARISCATGIVFVFNNCTNYKWFDGIINPGTGTEPSIFDVGLPPTTVAHPFTFFASSVCEVEGLTVDNGVGKTPTCITMWQCSIGKIRNCLCINGGDNSIWVFVSGDISTTGCIVRSNEAGRAICYQQVNTGVINGCNVSDGKGDGINVHGSDNIAITGNVVADMAVDPVVIGSSRGISVEWNELFAANPTAVAAAVADLHLYNGVFSREITISGNTVANVPIAAVVGDNVGSGSVSYGNNGVVTFSGNTFSDCGEGIRTGRSSHVSIVGNQIKDVLRGFVTIDTAADTGGYIAHDVVIKGNDFDNCDISASGFTGIHFLTSAVYAATRLIVASGNDFTRTASISNAALTLLLGSSANNGSIQTNGVYRNYEAPLSTFVPYGTEAVVSNLTASITSKVVSEFVLKGTVTDTFTTIYAIPADFSVIVDIQIGFLDRLSHVSTVYAHNCTTPAITILGINGTNIQLSGANLQIRGNTSGGVAPYGGSYIAKFRVLSA